MALNRIHIILLSILNKSQAVSSATAITTEEIENFCSLGKSYATLHRTITALYKNGYINKGLKAGKFQTHYITNKGLELLEEVK